MGDMIVAHDIRHGLKANQQITADGLRRRDTDDLIPRFKKQRDAGEVVLRLSIEDDLIGIDIEIDPSKSPYSSTGFSAYNLPTIKDKNPLYYALREKAKQLKGADAITGVILGDGDCTALADQQASTNYASADAIANEMLRQYSSIDFVLLLTIREEPQSYLLRTDPKRNIYPILVCRDGDSLRSDLTKVFAAMLKQFPQPIMTPKNAARRAREEGYDIGYHGGYFLEKSRIRMSARELIEVLTGLRTLDDNGARNVQPIHRATSPIKEALLRELAEGRLPVNFIVHETGENDNDSWIDIEFGEHDAAISPFV